MASNEVIFKRQAAINKIIKILKEKQDIDEKNLIHDIAAEFNVSGRTAVDFLQTAKSKRTIMEQKAIEEAAFSEEELLHAEELEKKSEINMQIAEIYEINHRARLKKLAKLIGEGKITKKEVTEELQNNDDYADAKRLVNEQISKGPQV